MSILGSTLVTSRAKLIESYEARDTSTCMALGHMYMQQSMRKQTDRQTALQFVSRHIMPYYTTACMMAFRDVLILYRGSV